MTAVKLFEMTRAHSGFHLEIAALKQFLETWALVRTWEEQIAVTYEQQNSLADIRIQLAHEFIALRQLIQLPGKRCRRQNSAEG